MKPRSNRFLRHAALAAITLAASAAAFAADSAWDTMINGLAWGSATWTNGIPGNQVGTTNTDIATFNNAGNITINGFNANRNIGSIFFDTTGATANNYVFTNSGNLLLTSGGSISTASTYKGVVNINLAPVLQGASGNYTLTSSGAAGSGLILQAAVAPATGLSTYTLNLNGTNTGVYNQVTGVISNSAATVTVMSVNKSGAGTWYLGGANTYTGSTTLNGGTVITNNAAALGAASGAINVTGSTTIRTLIALTDPSARFNISDGATLTFNTNNVAQTWAGLLTNSGASNTAGLTKTGLGQLTITPANGVVQTWKGTTTVNMGTLAISGASQTAGFSNLIDSSSALVLGGGNINFVGKVGFNNSQTFAGTTLNAGISGFIPASTTGNNTFDFGTITRNSGSLLDIQNLSTSFPKTGSLTQSTSIQGVLYQGLFANASSGVIGGITGSNVNAAGSWTSSSVDYVTNGAVTGSVGAGTTTINSLTLNNANSQSFTIGGTLALNNGLLFGNSTGANASKVSGGNITGGTANGDLIIVNNNAQNTIGRSEVNSTITDFTGGSTNLVLYSRAQNSTLWITGTNTYTGNTYIGGGANAATGNMVTLIGGASGASIGSSNATVYLNGGTGGSSNVLRIGNGDTTGDVLGTIQLDNGKLSFNRTDAGAGYTLSAQVAGTGGGGIISVDNTGVYNLTFKSGSNTLYGIGGTAAGTLNLNGAGSVNTFVNATPGSAGTFNVGQTTNFNSGTYYFNAGNNSGAHTVGNWNIQGADVFYRDMRYFNGGGGNVSISSGSLTGTGQFSTESASGKTISFNVSGTGLFNLASNAQNVILGGGTNANTVSLNISGGTFQYGLAPGSTGSQGFAIGSTVAGNNATLALSGGVARVYGTIKSTGVASAGGSNNFNWTGGQLTVQVVDMTNLTSNDGISGAATGTLFQGNNTVMSPGETFNGYTYSGKTAITGAYKIDGGSVAIGIGGTTAATTFHDDTAKYDSISVSGATTLGGRLNVALNNSYTPPSNMTTLYNIVVGSASGVTGTFTNQQTATSGNSRVVLADGLSSFLIAVNNTASAATTGGLTNVGARAVALGGYQAGNTYSGAGTAWDTASAGAWSNFDAGATATPATQASGAIAQFADGTASTGPIGVSLSSTRNIQGIQFSSVAGSRAYTISQGGSGAVVLDNTANSASATIADTSTSGTANAINVGIALNSNLAVSVTNSANTLTIGGDISGTGKSLTKTGSGTLALTASNSYTGATIVSGGKLTISSTGTINGTSGISVGSGEFNYNSSTALTVSPSLGGDTISNRAVLGGTGPIGVAVTLDNVGDVLAPGNSPGIQPYTASQSWNSFSYDWETNDFSGTSAGTQFDQIGITGALALTGGTGSYILNVLSLTGVNAAGDAPNFSEISKSWNVLTTTSGITGFNAANWTVNASGFTNPDTGTWTISESGGNLVLSYAIPEPNVAALLGGLGMLALLRRRR